MAKVSVVIPTYNRANYLLQAMDSVLAQTYKDYEVVVVDDGSTDGTQALLKPLIDKGKIRYYQNPGRGVSAARNFGAQNANGKYLAFLDSDDLFLSAKLEKQVALIEQRRGIGMVHSHYSKFNDAGEDLGLRDTSRYQGSIYPGLLNQWGILMAPSCTLIPKTVFEEVGGYDEAMRWAEDLDLWRRIAYRYPLDLVPEVLTRVRVHSGNTSQQRAQALNDFQRYIDKALTDDPNLSKLFQRRAQATMRSHFALTMLGEGKSEEMRLVRRLSLQSLADQPLKLVSLISWIISWLPLTFRQGLAKIWRRMRHSPVDDL